MRFNIGLNHVLVAVVISVNLDVEALYKNSIWRIYHLCKGRILLRIF